MNRTTLIVMVATAIGVVGCTAETPRTSLAETPARSEVTPTVSSGMRSIGANVRLSADQIQALTDGVELLSGHVAIQFPASNELRVSGDKVTRHKGSSMEWDGNVHILLGGPGSDQRRGSGHGGWRNDHYQYGASSTRTRVQRGIGAADGLTHLLSGRINPILRSELTGPQVVIHDSRLFNDWSICDCKADVGDWQLRMQDRALAVMAQFTAL